MKFKKRSYTAAFFTAFVFFTGLSSIASFADDETGNGKVKKTLTFYSVVLQLGSRNGTQYAGYYAALEKGFYKNEGIIVTIFEGKDEPGYETINEVLNNKAVFATGNSDIIKHLIAGKDIILLASIFQHSPTGLATLKSSPFMTVENLKDARIQVGKRFNSDIISMLNKENVYNEKNLKFLDMLNLDDLIKHKTDAIQIDVTKDPLYFDKKGTEINIIYPFNSGVDFYGDCLFSSASYVKSNSYLAEAFVRASLMGWSFAMENQDEMADILVTKLNPTRTKSDILFELSEMHKLIMPDIIELGHINPQRWDKIASVYEKAGLVKTSSFSSAKYVYRPQRVIKYESLTKITAIGIVVISLTILIIVAMFFYNKKLVAEINRRSVALNSAEIEIKARNDFLVKMNHEIRVPLNAIIGMTDLVFLSTDENEKFEYLLTVKESAKHLLEIINDVLVFSKIESMKILMESVNFNLKNLVDRTLSIFEIKAREKKLNISRDYSDDIAIWVKGDQVRLRQILINLLSNAVKFTDSGEIYFSIFKEVIGNEKINVVFQIRDTGIGISQAKQKEIVSEYYGSSFSSSKYERMGLGLPIAIKLIKLMGGGLSIESEEGHGSVFKFNVMLDKGAPIERQYSEAKIAKKVLHVLVVEDNIMNLKLATVVLERLGHKVIPVLNGKDAIKEMTKNRYDLVLMDIEMPDMDGFETTLRIRRGEAGERNINIPIIAMTGHATDGTKEMCKKVGMDMFLTKPFEISDIEEIIMKSIGKG